MLHTCYTDFLLRYLVLLSFLCEETSVQVLFADQIHVVPDEVFAFFRLGDVLQAAYQQVDVVVNESSQLIESLATVIRHIVNRRVTNVLHV